MITHKALVRKMLKQPAVKAEYDAQAEEFALRTSCSRHVGKPV